MGIAEDLQAADIFYPLHDWPIFWRRLFFKRHKLNSERYRLFAFLYLNGMDPVHCAYWVLYHQTYDDAATRDINRLASKLKEEDPKTIERMNRNHVYDMVLRRVI